MYIYMYIYIYICIEIYVYLKGCALLPPAPFVHLQIYELVAAKLPKSMNQTNGNINGILMKGVSFLVSFCGFLGVVFLIFPDLGLASVVKGGPGLNKMQKGRKTVKKGIPK